MKGHKFDWRKKRRPPFCTFIDCGLGGYVTGYRPVRKMHRHPTPKRDPLVRWLGKRGTVCFIARYGVRF